MSWDLVGFAVSLALLVADLWAFWRSVRGSQMGTGGIRR